jgi:hypothetical protein
MGFRGLASSLALLALAGCSSGIQERYHWNASTLAYLRSDEAQCQREANSHYVPWIVFLFGGWQIRQTIYKDCMEGRGYTLTGKEAV